MRNLHKILCNRSTKAGFILLLLLLLLFVCFFLPGSMMLGVGKEAAVTF